MTIPYADMELHPEEEADPHTMTNAEFARFVRERGYQAEAEAALAGYRRPARSLWVPLALVGLGLAVAVAWLVLR